MPDSVSASFTQLVSTFFKLDAFHFLWSTHFPASLTWVFLVAHGVLLFHCSIASSMLSLDNGPVAPHTKHSTHALPSGVSPVLGGATLSFPQNGHGLSFITSPYSRKICTTASVMIRYTTMIISKSVMYPSVLSRLPMALRVSFAKTRVLVDAIPAPPHPESRARISRARLSS